MVIPSEQFVYPLHMPGFLIISGYLMKVQPTDPNFRPNYHYALAVPYFIMEQAMLLWPHSFP